PSKWDAWDIDSMYPLTPVALVEPAEIEVLADGPLFARLRVTRTLNNSTMVQQIILRRNCRRIDFHTVVDWQESHKMLKVHFPVTVRAEDALHEIQFGHVRRPTHRNRQYDADRFEVTNHKWTALVEEARGCAVLNDCKYGVSVDGHSINLTLLKSALAPDMTADKGRQEFTYAFYAWQGSLMASGLVQAGYELNVPLQTAAGGAGQASLFALDTANIIVDTVKPAEDGSGDVIVRLYESMRTATRCRLTTALPVGRAALTDMLEN
ncbi:MAG: alpha-mannosidase, partial [Anaerolineae bacterium]|nr:alpha-mannosidase [Anaerolineae bacterium]